MTADEIKLAISIHDILDRYGFEVSKKGYMSCPFHDEKTDSFKVYDNSFYCFGCGAGGDATKFVRMLFKLDFSQTITKLKYDFGFIDTCDLTYRQKQQLMFKQREIKSKQTLLKAKKEYSNNAYIYMCCYRRWCVKQKQTVAIQFDIEYIDKTLDMYLDRNSIIDWDIKARLTALMSKHRGW